MPCYAEMELRHTPILLNKIELTVIFWVEITQVTARLN